MPASAREAIVQVGLNGATGTLAIDNVTLTPHPRCVGEQGKGTGKAGGGDGETRPKNAFPSPSVTPSPLRCVPLSVGSRTGRIFAARRIEGDRANRYSAGSLLLWARDSARSLRRHR